MEHSHIILEPITVLGESEIWKEKSGSLPTMGASIDTNTYGQTKGRNGSYSTNYQQTGRELFTPDEIRLLDNRKAILFVRGERPMLDDKYNLKKHPNVKWTEDGGAPPYDYAKAPRSHDDLNIDIERLDDYELLCEEDILGKEQPF